MPDEEITIDPAFEGPPSSGHGGYTCGRLASYLPADAEITLRAPVPLGTALRLVPVGDGVALHAGMTVVAEGASTRLADGAPEPPSFAGLRFHPYPRCVAARLLEPVPVGGPHIVVGWLDRGSGRKLVAGSALYSRDGALQGFSRQTWITLPPAGTPS
jgi:hypothetical protein